MEHPWQVEIYGQHAAKIASRLIIIPLSIRALGAWKVCIFAKLKLISKTIMI